jgi:hypothetical protein
MKSGMFQLTSGDFLRGLVMAILSGILLPVLAAIQTPDFSILTVNWHAVFVLAINGGITGIAAYLVKNLFTDNSGKFAGKIG